MDRQSTQPRKAQLDKAEREHLEDIVTEMRDRVEANVRYQLKDEYDLDEKPNDDASLSEEQEDLVEAIELEAVDGNDWDDGYEQYITGVGYTIVNRLAALRCMEVRDFIDDEVTAFRDDGLTPAADRLVTEEFMLEEEAVLEAYRNACDDLAEEIEILFDRSTAYSQIDPDDDTFEDLCGMLDKVPDEVWRADDVLGWVYEYYNVKLLDDLREKGGKVGLDPEDVPPANQFYTPHWVVRMLTDNSLGKLYLEDQNELRETIDAQDKLTAEERKNRGLSPDESPTVSDFCTYLVSDDEEGKPTDFDQPKDITVIDPACGSGHFLLYAFDVLERIWRAETDVEFEKIPRKILQHNLHGIDLDMRACQLAAFNLYLKGRTRAENEGATGFDMPKLGIVCADSKVADIDGVEEVFDEVAGNKPEIEDALRRILDSFEEIHGLGSLLDVRGTLRNVFEDNIDKESVQIKLGDEPRDDHTLGDVLGSLGEAVEQQHEGDSFLARDLRSFIRLLDMLAKDYDVALMNPPYGSGGLMPGVVQNYVENHYDYSPEFYINFFEVCSRMTKPNGRIGMLVPRTFMVREMFEEFRDDFLGQSNGFDFLAEFGIGILDNATVRTAGTVIRSGGQGREKGTFIRLYDLEKSRKEQVFVDTISGLDTEIKRLFQVELDEFSKIPGKTISYSIPEEVRNLHNTDVKLDPEQAGIDGESMGLARPGLLTANDQRFIKYHWETQDFDLYKMIAKGGADAWIVPQVYHVFPWNQNGAEIKRSSSGVRIPNEELYGNSGLIWTLIKETGRRFGYCPPGRFFSKTGYMYIPHHKDLVWPMMAVLNSDLYHAIFLSITPERDWNAGEVGSLPWYKSINNNADLGEMAKNQYEIMMNTKVSDATNPYYISPLIHPDADDLPYFYKNPYQNDVDDYININTDVSKSDSIGTAAYKVEKENLQALNDLEDISDKINEIVYDSFNINSEVQDRILTEIDLRTAGDPRNRYHDLSTLSNPPENLDLYVKDLIHHFAMEAIREEDDGIIMLETTDEQPDMLDRIIERFHDTYAEYAEDRLIEIDDVLGTASAADEAYPNLRAFVEEDLFSHHVHTMENTPIFWKLSTKRLLADADNEGFACFIDYHQLDASLFDRISNQYLESRKAELRERRSAANQRRNDESLSTSERADATDEFEFCSSALEQIAELEEVMQELGSTNERDFDTADKELAEELAPKVATFREETAERINILAELRERNGEDWFKDAFSDGFWDKVDEWRDEWLDALDELQHACSEYAKPNDEPVKAHLADLFDYFSWRLKGSDHYSSTGILFMTYYFEREGVDLLNEDGEPFENLTDDEQLLASLATGVDDTSVIDEEYLEQIADDENLDDVDDLPPLAEFKALAEEIDDRCQTISKEIPSNWTDRALSEITTAGYQPNQKHGVEINITPLAEKDIVPEVVDDKVL